MRAVVIFVGFGLAGCQTARDAYDEVCPEQTRIEFRRPEAFPRTPLPTVAPPRTVSNPDNGQPELRLSLEIAAHKAIIMHSQIECCRGSIVYYCRAEPLG